MLGVGVMILHYGLHYSEVCWNPDLTDVLHQVTRTYENFRHSKHID